MTLSCDHRVVDGAVGATFLAELRAVSSSTRRRFLSAEGDSGTCPASCVPLGMRSTSRASRGPHAGAWSLAAAAGPSRRAAAAVKRAPPRPLAPSAPRRARTRRSPCPPHARAAETVLLRGTLHHGLARRARWRSLALPPPRRAGPVTDLLARSSRSRARTRARGATSADYWIDRTEVTVARYRHCVAAGRCSEPPYAVRRRALRPPGAAGGAGDLERRPHVLRVGRRPPPDRGRVGARRARRRAAAATPGATSTTRSIANHGRFAWDDLDASDGFLELAPVGSFPDGRTPRASTISPATSRSGSPTGIAPEYAAGQRREPARARRRATSASSAAAATSTRAPAAQRLAARDDAPRTAAAPGAASAARGTSGARADRTHRSSVAAPGVPVGRTHTARP